MLQPLDMKEIIIRFGVNITTDCILQSVFFEFARHGRALMGASPEYAQIVGSV